MSDEVGGLIERAAALLHRPGLPRHETHPGDRQLAQPRHEARFGSYRDLSERPDVGLSAQAVLSSIRRHLAVVLLLSLGMAAAGAAIGLGLPQRFEASADLVINSRPQRVADVEQVLPDPDTDARSIRSEVDVLQSRSVIEQVVRSLALWRFPEFQKTAYPRGWNRDTLIARLRGLWDDSAAAAGEPSPTDARSQRDVETPSHAQFDLAMGKYASYLSVKEGGESMTIQVAFAAWTPERAAAIVNAHVEAYQHLQELAKATAAQRATSWLREQASKLQTELQVTETAIAQYREQHRLTSTAADNGVLAAQLASLNTQLIAARAELAENEARATSIGTRADQQGGAASVPEIVASPTVEMFRGKETELVQRIGNLSAYFGDSYPELQRDRAALAKVRSQISAEMNRGLGAARKLVDRSRAREESIQQSIEELTKQINSSDAGLRQLQGKAESIRVVLQNFQRRSAETASEPAFIVPNSRIVSRADPSSVSTSPITLALSGGGGFAGLIFGGLIAIFLDRRDSTFRTSTQVEEQVGLRAVGATPRAFGHLRASPADAVLNDPKSVFAEALRLSWANIQLALEGPRGTAFGEQRFGTVLGITSAIAGEGKSTHALGLARTAALAGETVVLVDADLRRSGVSRLLGQRPRATLGEFLQGRCTAAEAVAVEPQSGIHFVASTPVEIAWTRHDLRQFSELVSYLRGQYAVVIIDLPPILGLAETIRLAVATDNVALVVRWGRTERQLVQFALDALRHAGVLGTAVILNDVHLQQQRRRGYLDRTVVYSTYYKPNA